MGKKGSDWPDIGKKASNQHVQAQLLIDDAQALIAYGNPKDDSSPRAIGTQCPFSTMRKFCEGVITHLQTGLENDTPKQLNDFMLRMEAGQNSLKTIIIESIKHPTSSSIPQGTTPGKQTPSTWAEIAKNTIPLPPSIANRATAPGKHTTVSKAASREIFIKINDTSKVQALRGAADPPRTIVSKIVTGLILLSKKNNNTENIEKIHISDARILPSGDILIHTETPSGAETLKRHRDWVTMLGEKAEVVVPTYGIIIHGIPIKSIQMEQQEKMINIWKDGNQSILGDCDIRSLGWLTRPEKDKTVTSIIMEFGRKEDANRAIHAGSLSWGYDPKQTVRYDRECRIHQCFKCHQYGHKGPQCRNTERCGICAEKGHRANDCSNTQNPSKKKCAVCEAPHVAWSLACEHRQRERTRTRKAREISAKYWEEDPNGTTISSQLPTSTFNSTPASSFITLSQFPLPKQNKRGRSPGKKDKEVTIYNDREERGTERGNEAAKAKNGNGKRNVKELKSKDSNVEAGKKRVLEQKKAIAVGQATSTNEMTLYSPHKTTRTARAGNEDGIEEISPPDGSARAASPPITEIQREEENDSTEENQTTMIPCTPFTQLQQGTRTRSRAGELPEQQWSLPSGKS